MKIFWKLLALSLFPLFCSAQQIEIRYIGNCAYRIKLDSVEIFTDFPYKSGAYGYLEYDMDSVELGKPNQFLLFTHKHKDHYSGKLVRKSGLPKITPLLPKRRKHKLLQELSDKYGIQVREFKTAHKYSVKHRSLAIEWKGKKIFLFGDTENDFPDYLKTNNIDLLFITGWQIPKLKLQDYNYAFRNVVVYHLRPQNSGNTALITKYMDDHLGFLSSKPNYIILQQYKSTIIY